MYGSDVEGVQAHTFNPKCDGLGGVRGPVRSGSAIRDSTGASLMLREDTLSTESRVYRRICSTRPTTAQSECSKTAMTVRGRPSACRSLFGLSS